MTKIIKFYIKIIEYIELYFRDKIIGKTIYYNLCQ